MYALERRLISSVRLDPEGLGEALVTIDGGAVSGKRFQHNQLSWSFSDSNRSLCSDIFDFEYTFRE